MNKNKLVIIVEGGVVSGVYGEENNVKIEVIDSDCMSSSEFEQRVEKAREKCKVELY